MNAAEPDPVSEVWTYVGRRANDKAAHAASAWLDASGEERWYTSPKMAATVVGGRYRLDVVRDGDRASVIPSSREYVEFDADADADAVARWLVLDEAARAKHSRRAAERKAAKNTALDEALRPLEQVARQCKSIYEVDELVAIARTRIFKAFSS